MLTTQDYSNRSNESHFHIEIATAVVSICIVMAIQTIISRTGMQTDYLSITAIIGIISIVVFMPMVLDMFMVAKINFPPLVSLLTFVIILTLGAIKKDILFIGLTQGRKK